MFPLNLKNFKENSINLCAGYYAWTFENGIVYYCKSRKEFSLLKNTEFCEEHKLSKRKSAIIRINQKEQYIILLPQATTLIETKEILATGSNIGGTYHSKVGMVSQGIGHIGTMLGPNFSGNSLIALHNVTKNLIVLKVGESFVSVVFHYLDTPIIEKNPTVSGHVDKMSELGITLSKSQREDLAADWKGDLEKVREKMMDSKEFKELQERVKKQRIQKLKLLINKKNIFILLILILIITTLISVSYWLDNRFNTNDWSNRCWNIVGSGVLVTIIGGLIKSLKKC
ncbi:MAG: hypothetical protein ACK5MV_06080 [Aminipila sp.]